MKILCVVDSLGSGGSQRQMVELAKGFKNSGHDILILTYHESNFYKESLNAANIAVVQINSSNYLKRLLKIRRFIRSGNFDAVLSFLEGSNFICEFAGLPRRKWKLVVGERSANPNMLKSLRVRFYKLFHLFADYVVANSYENIRMLKKINPLLANHKCKVIYNSIDLDYWKPNPNYVPLEGSQINILVAARHHYLKNLAGLVEAIRLLKESDRRRVKINWFGDEKDSSLKDAMRLIQKYSLEGNFNFFPATTKILQEMQMTDIVALFSFYEGLPNAVCEGMAVGKPIICSKVSDIPVLLSTSGAGLCAAERPETISKAIEYHLSLDPKTLLNFGLENRDIAKKLFCKETIIRSYLELLQND